MDHSYRIVETAAGPVGMVASRKGLKRVFLPVRSADEQRRQIGRDFPAARESRALLPDVADGLKRFFAGEPTVFRVAFDWSDATAFETQVWRACARIRYGSVESYAGLAARMGRPKAARAIGNAMGRNPCPIVIPCHRVVRSNGSIGGYSGDLGVPFKQRLLEMERQARTEQK